MTLVELYWANVSPPLGAVAVTVNGVIAKTPFESSKVANEVGAFSENLTVVDQVNTIVRRSELRRGWIDAAAFALLREVAAVEHRAQRRRLIIEQSAPSSGGSTH